MSGPDDDMADEMADEMDDGALTDEHVADELLERVAAALSTHDPVPDHVVAGARAAFTWRTIDAELAELVFDSATELTGVRSALEDAPRQVTFRAPGVEIEVMVIDDGSRRIVGQLVPSAEVTVRLTSTGAVREAATDRFGRFAFDDVTPGPVRLSVLGGGGWRLVHTEWVLL